MPLIILTKYLLFSYWQVFIKVLDVNDNPPKFSRALYARKLVENVAVDTVVQVVHANDADIGKNGNVKYKITAGNEAGNVTLKTMSIYLDIDWKISEVDIVWRPGYTVSYYLGQVNGMLRPRRN